jgi:hypothetical protein
VPQSQIVVGRVGILAEKSFNQIAGVIEHEDNWLEAATSELTNLLRGKLVRSLAGHQNQTTLRDQTHPGFARELAEPGCDERGVLLVAADHCLDTGVEERVEDAVDFRARYSENMLDALSFKIADEDLCTASVHSFTSIF